MLDEVDPKFLTTIKKAVQEGLSENRPEWLTSAEAAAYIKVHPEYLQKLRTQNKGPPYHRLGPRLIRYKRADLDAFLAE